MKYKIIDTHSHINCEPLLGEADAIIKHCLVESICLNVVGTNYENSVIAVEQAKKYPNVFAIVGLHPCDVNEESQITIDKLDQLIKENINYIVAIGEIGLDYHYQPMPSKELQKKYFLAQIKLAEKYNLPIECHIRDAHDDAVELLKVHSPKCKGVIHCFEDEPKYVPIYLELGYYISVSGIVTFKKAARLNEALALIKPDKLLTETDGPWLAPVPHRGKTNYPYYVQHVNSYIANKLMIDLDELENQLMLNANVVFGYNQKINNINSKK